MAIAIEHLHNLCRIGFPIVGLYDDSRTATYAYVKGDPPIFSNPDFWNAEKIDFLLLQWKVHQCRLLYFVKAILKIIKAKTLSKWPRCRL